MTNQLLRTQLYDLHLKRGAKMVPFAGYEMPVQYNLGVMKEHLHTRKKVGLFDISHMGQVSLSGKDYKSIADELEKLIPMDVMNLEEGRQRYGFFTNENGGIQDDIMFANLGDHILLIVNSACVTDDISHLKAHVSSDIQVQNLTNRALLALQGPNSEAVLAKHCPEVLNMRFLDILKIMICGAECYVSRSGYTGEDGFEISVPKVSALDFANLFLQNRDVTLIGLGARDTLRLEAGLCLYGHDIDHTTSPVEASLCWAIQKRRKLDGNFPGAKRILKEIATGPSRKRVGLKPEGRAPVREDSTLFIDEYSKCPIGYITSGSFGPTVGNPISMGYVMAQYATTNAILFAQVRNKRLPVSIVDIPFIKPNFKR